MVGNIAPDFTLPDQNGNEFNLYKNLNKNVLIIFYPKDNTTVCSTQLRDYQHNIEKFADLNVQLIAINTADIDSHRSFCEKISIEFPILSDDQGKVSKLYKAINFLGINKRMVVLIGTDKKIKLVKKMLSINYSSSDELINVINSLRIN